MDLIKTVRNLDQAGPGDDGQNLQLLWSQLAVSVDTQFHAAEESSLRWLLKLMNGSTPAAETMRRFPLSWTIIECIFRRMPLLSLAKTLAFRKFVAVLQQTVVDLARRADDETTAKLGKRKRDSTLKYELECLQSEKAQLQAAGAVFKALRALLLRLNHVSAYDRIGAEHIRSLFCTSAADAIKIVRPLFQICGKLLSAEDGGELDDSQEWISITASLWELHLQGEGDPAEVATGLLRDILLLVRGLEQMDKGSRAAGTAPQRWNADIYAFLQRVVTQPAKAAYIGQKKQEVIALTLETNIKELGLIAPTLYHVLSESSISSEVRRRKGETEWLEDAFHVIEEAIRGLDGRETLLKSILQCAAETSMPIKVEHLRLACQEYALKDNTRWDILALAVACDADIFQVTEFGESLLATVCQRMLVEVGADGTVYESMTQVVNGVLKGFRTSRNMTGFLKLWYRQMCKAEEHSSSLQSPWFYVGQWKHEHSLSTSIERQLSPQQLLDVLEWVVETGVYQQSLSIFLAGISEGVETDGFADAVCQKVFEVSQLLVDSSSKSWATALRWTTISRLLAWFPCERRGQTWDIVHKSLGKVLKKGDIESANCFEAFKCCCQAWSSMSPDDSRLSEPLALLQTFSDRLISLIPEKGVPTMPPAVDFLQVTEYDFAKGPYLTQYIAWYSRGHSRLAHLITGEKNAVPLVAEVAGSLAGKSIEASQSTWEALVENDQLWQNRAVTPVVVSRLIVALEESARAQPWPYVGAQKWLRLLSDVPSDAFTRQQREKVMAVLVGKAEVRGLKARNHANLSDWRCLLSLLVKLAVRPTFYEGMQFDDLVSVVDTLCEHLMQEKPDDESLIEIIERATELATAIFRQMSENVDERSLKYLSGVASLVSIMSQQATTLDNDSTDITTLPLRLILVKSLVSQLSRSANCRSSGNLDSVRAQAQETVSNLIAAVINRWVNDKSSRRDQKLVFVLYTALDAAHALGAEVDLASLKSSKLRKLDQNSYEGMAEGELRGWTIQIFLRTYLPTYVAEPLPSVLPPLRQIPSRLREAIVARMMDAVSKNLTLEERFGYVRSLISNAADVAEGQHEQVIAIDRIIRQMIDSDRTEEVADSSVFPALYGELILCLPRITNRTDASRLGRLLQQLLETSPRPLGQWNIELTLEKLCDLSSQEDGASALPFTGICKVLEVVIKKHRLRLEGHYHLLTALLQALLCKLIAAANAVVHKGPKAQAAPAHSFGRVITLICEPTTGAVSRGQQQGPLSSATDAAKRSAGKHMYLVLMQYVKLQLEGGVARPVQEALEPAMNSIFDITSPEGRKILNDAMNASGRAILREMFKRYTKFGKWSGV